MTQLGQRLEMVVRCVRCSRPVLGSLSFDRLTIVDSAGFMFFDEGAVCDSCIGD